MLTVRTFILFFAFYAGAFAAENGVIFRDDFKDNHNGWKEVFGLKDLKAVVEKGKFVVNNNLMQTYLRQDGVLAGRKDFEIEAVFSNIKSEGGGDFGLKFDTVDQKNSYTFTINGKRQYFFSYMVDGNKIPAGPGKFSEHIRLDSNTLAVKCFNGTLDLVVNGKLVDATDCAAAPWDRAGFIVSAKVAVDVDDFAVREPGAVEPAPGKKAVKKKKVKKKKIKKKAVPDQPAGSGAKPAGISLGDLPGMSKKPEAAAPAKKAARKGKVPPPAAEEPAAGE